MHVLVALAPYAVSFSTPTVQLSREVLINTERFDILLRVGLCSQLLFSLLLLLLLLVVVAVVRLIILCVFAACVCVCARARKRVLVLRRDYTKEIISVHL